MARRVKPKIKYNKNKKAPKAFVGAATAALGLGKAIYGGIQARKARKAQEAFDKGRLERGVSSATRRMVDEPIDQDYIEGLEQSRLASQATAMRNLARDPRASLSGAMGLQRQAREQELGLLGKQQQAKTQALQRLSQEQQMAETQRLGVAEAELKGLVGQKAAAEQNIFGGLEDIASGIGQMKDDNAKEGAKIDKDGGVTPGKFDHDSNPIDMVKDGEKIGEATGGELILPPDDVQEIRMALDKGDKESAFELMERLVAKYDSNVIGDDDNEAQEGAKVQQPTVPPLNQDRAQEIVRVMKGNADQVRNVGELPFDEDPTNPAGLVKYVGDKLSFDIDSTSKAEIDFIKNYRDFLIQEKGRVDAPKKEMMGGGYLAKVKARMGSYIKSKM
tara:strand:- start:2833 stop:4002 length:1170 start_codon:yes stop_codon:yes gene_type:complete